MATNDAPISDPESGGRKRTSTAAVTDSTSTSQTGPSQVAPPAAKRQRRTVRSIADGQVPISLSSIL